MRIAFIVTGLPPHDVGGTETQTMNLARNLAGRHEVTILTRRVKGAPDEERIDGVRIIRFRFFPFPVLRFFSHTLSCLRLVRKLKDETDCLFCMMLSPNGLVGALAARLFGMKSAASERGGDWYTGEKRFLGRRINGFVIRNSSVVIAQTDKIKREMLGRYPGARIEVINNGVDMSPIRAKGKAVVFAGNLQQRKGVAYLIEAMAKLDAELIVIGDGPERAALEQLARKLGISCRAHFEGRVKPQDMRRHMARGRVFVLPSVEGEGLPNVILEAMSIGLPVVSTRISGIPDIVKDGETGFIVEPGDADALADRIDRLITDKPLCDRMRASTLKEVRRYSWESITRRVDEVLGSL